MQCPHIPTGAMLPGRVFWLHRTNNRVVCDGVMALREAVPHLCHHTNTPTSATMSPRRKEGLLPAGTGALLREGPAACDCLHWDYEAHAHDAGAQTEARSVGLPRLLCPSPCGQRRHFGPTSLSSPGCFTWHLGSHRPCHAAPSCPSLAVACPQGRLSPFAHRMCPNCRGASPKRLL